MITYKINKKGEKQRKMNGYKDLSKTAEMAQWVRLLAMEIEGLGLGLQYSCKRLVILPGKPKS